MKKLIGLSTTLVLLFSFAFASAANLNNNNQREWYNGIYFGAMIGYADTNYTRGWLTSKTNFISVDKIDTQGVAGRFFLGYAFTKYIALEAGYLALQNVEFKDLDGVSSRNRLQQYPFDFSLRLSLPCSKYFDLYARGGFAYVHRHGFTENSKTYDPNDKFPPLAAAGLKINVTQHFSLVGEASLYFKYRDLPYTEFYGGGVMYTV